MIRSMSPIGKRDYTCKICNTTFINDTVLTDHINNVEHLTSEQYFDMFYKNDYPNEGKCKLCGKPTKLISAVYGYDDYCSDFCYHNDFANNIDAKIMI